jgi:hypothetical protein
MMQGRLFDGFHPTNKLVFTRFLLQQYDRFNDAQNDLNEDIYGVYFSPPDVVGPLVNKPNKPK